MPDIEKEETPVVVDGQPAVENVEEKPVADGAVPPEEDFSKFEPEVRKRPIDYIEERRASRAAAPDTKVEAPEEKLSPESREYLDRALESRLKPIASTLADTFNRQEIEQEVLKHPEWKRYVPLVEKYMKHDAYQGVPPKMIFQSLDYEHAENRGADAAKEAEVQGKRARGGSSPRPAAKVAGGELSAEDIAKLSPEQFNALQTRIKTGEQIRTT